MKLFLLLFRRAAFLSEHGDTFHQRALRDGRQWEARVARDLSDTVFGHVFPALAQALAVADAKPATALDPAALEEVREGALILLYRLLFILYAEDRNLLPDESGPYAGYSLTQLRHEVAGKRARGEALSERMTTYWARIDGVFQAMAKATTAWAYPPTTAACSTRPRRRSWRAPACPTPWSPTSSSGCRTSRPPTAARRSISTTATFRCSSSARSTSGSSSTG